MWPYAILAILLAMAGAVSVGSNGTSPDYLAEGRSEALAQNIIIYNNLVSQFVAAQPAGYTAPAAGNAVPDASLSLPTWYVKDASLRNSVVSGVVVIYTAGPVPDSPYVERELFDRTSGLSQIGIRTSAGTASRYGEYTTTFSVPAVVAAGSVVISTRVH